MGLLLVLVRTQRKHLKFLYLCSFDVCNLLILLSSLWWESAFRLKTGEKCYFPYETSKGSGTPVNGMCALGFSLYIVIIRLFLDRI